MQERLQKLIARAGVTSRRAAEVMIAQGRVTVNAVVVKDAGSKADAASDTITVDGTELHFDAPRMVLMMHKPEKTMVTMNDPERRATIVGFLQKSAFSGRGPESLPRVFPVGRLDYDAQGLLLLTNDGDLAQSLIHPKYHVPKTYLVKVSDVVQERNLVRIRKGIMLKELDGRIKRTLPADVKLHRTTEKHGWYEITVFEGRNHLVKRLFAAVGHPVRRILRIDFGGVQLGDLPEGEWRELTEQEIFKLERWLEQGPQAASQREPLPIDRPAGANKPASKFPAKKAEKPLPQRVNRSKRAKTAEFDEAVQEYEAKTATRKPSVGGPPRGEHGPSKVRASKTSSAGRPLVKPKEHGFGQGQKAQRRSGKSAGEGARGQGARNLRQGPRSRSS